MSKLLSAAEILQHTTPTVTKVEVPEWGGHVFVRGMTGSERDAWETSMSVQRGNKLVRAPHNIRAKLAVKCMVDQAGQRLFHDGQIDELGALPAAGLDRVVVVAARLSGIGDEDVEEAVEDFGKAAGSGSSTP